jgi:hypothetical protein
VDNSGFQSGAGNVFVPCIAWQGLQISPLRFHRYPRKSWGDPTIVPAEWGDSAVVPAEWGDPTIVPAEWGDSTMVPAGWEDSAMVPAEVMDDERNIRIITAADILFFRVIIYCIRFLLK